MEFNYSRSNLQPRQFTGFSFFSLMWAYLLLLTAQFLFSSSELPLSDLHFVPTRLSDPPSRCGRRRPVPCHSQQLQQIPPPRPAGYFTPYKGGKAPEADVEKRGGASTEQERSKGNCSEHQNHRDKRLTLKPDAKKAPSEEKRSFNSTRIGTTKLQIFEDHKVTAALDLLRHS